MSLSDESDRTLDARAAPLVPDDPYASDPSRPATSAAGPWWRWLFVLPGLAAVAYGGYGLLTAGDRIPLDSWLRWFVGSALVHDLVVVPVWLALGWAAARWLPAPARAPALVAAVVSGVLTVVALPFVLGYGADEANPSFLPRDYGRDLLLVVAGVLLVGAVWGAVAIRRARAAERRRDDCGVIGA
ncbi:hypothetical protein [Blastococcus sp. TF02A-26]|uniref:hypothetical protein n=1 Tax=Blastococcus sp. TF02A-26 TaxID=2250577 RepID=UPI000DE81A30|nr:hypothetical protein [Blastococcus sp. TF02A-26]RBY86208.1 hypothetical protein DQ240_10520 [Blastococcus sp. TF02A-26]